MVECALFKVDFARSESLEISISIIYDTALYVTDTWQAQWGIAARKSVYANVPPIATLYDHVMCHMNILFVMLHI